MAIDALIKARFNLDTFMRANPPSQELSAEKTQKDILHGDLVFDVETAQRNLEVAIAKILS